MGLTMHKTNFVTGITPLAYIAEYKQTFAIKLHNAVSRELLTELKRVRSTSPSKSNTFSHMTGDIRVLKAQFNCKSYRSQSGKKTMKYIKERKLNSVTELVNQINNVCIIEFHCVDIIHLAVELLYCSFVYFR